MPRTHTFDRIGRPIPDPWTTLGVPRGAPPETIRVAYRDLVLAHPPESDPEAFRSISAAGSTCSRRTPPTASAGRIERIR